MIHRFSDRISQLITLADKTLSTAVTPEGMIPPYVDGELFNELRASSLSFIQNMYGIDHPYFKEFSDKVEKTRPSQVEFARGILKAIKNEIDGGWLVTMKGLISAEIFSDFLEMADHLIKEGYKDSASVMIGSVLEEHLRQLCIKNGIPTNEPKTGRPKKADLLNSELGNATIYNKLDQKNVTAWLDLRNKAAHGKYGEYNQQQVEFMLQAVTEFMTRNNV
jgi:hypothetical protein